MNDRTIPEKIIDPIAVLEERERTQKEEAERNAIKAAEQAAKDAEAAKANQKLVPELVKTFLAAASNLYEAALEADYPQLVEAKLIEVIDHDAQPTPAPGPFGKQRWYQKLFRSSLPPIYRDTIMPAATKKRPCWEATWINLDGNRPFVYVYIDVEDGQLYCNSFKGSLLSALNIDTLNTDELYELTYKELSTMLEHLSHKKRQMDSIVERRRWEIDRTERQQSNQ